MKDDVGLYPILQRLDARPDLTEILLCTFLPIALYFLALLLTHNNTVALLTSVISIFHLGFTLSTTYIMTDALTTLFFTFFLIFFYKVVDNNTKKSLIFTILAAIMLSIVTYMRPMGQSIGFLAVLILFFSAIPLKKKLFLIALFSLLFFGSLTPWIVRNYTLTNSPFFCPLWGPYNKHFQYLKLHKDSQENHLLRALTISIKNLCFYICKRKKKKKKENSPYIACRELICAQVANPIIYAYPHYFMLDWCIEVVKTAFT